MRRLSGRPWPIWRKSRAARSIVARSDAFMFVVSRASSSPFMAWDMAVNVPESTTSMMPMAMSTSGGRSRRSMVVCAWSWSLSSRVDVYENDEMYVISV